MKNAMLFAKGLAAAVAAAAVHAGIDAATNGGAAAMLPAWAQPVLLGGLFVAAWFKKQPAELRQP